MTYERNLHTAPFKLNRKLVVVSNREPYVISVHKKRLKIEKTQGGLVSALDPVLRESKGLWICWEGSGATEQVSYEDLKALAALNDIHIPYEIRGVSLTEKEINHYYYGFANRQLWPVFHYFPTRCHFNHSDWQHYFSANQKFARAILEEAAEEDLIWVHDYQLMLVPGMVRQSRPDRNIGFFCHIPFPNYEIFRILPRRKELLRGVLGSDLIGFHIPSYVDNFLECVQGLLAEEATVDLLEKQIFYQGRVINVNAFPISVDFQQIEQTVHLAETQAMAQKLRNAFDTEFIGIGVDRLDYSKGILERLEAISLFFERYPEYKKRMVFIQIAVPSRTKVKEYQEMKEQIEQAVGRINGKFSEGSWAPIQYLYRSFPMQQLLPYYMLADFALITPLRDGMNLVAKEYCVAKTDNRGVLILSELAGASHQLKQGLIVNPYNKHEVADTIRHALQMPTSAKESSMRHLRHHLAKEDIHHWLSQYLTALLDAVCHRDKTPVLL